ncbi:hypothetical protein VR41_10510 [Streptomyces sp. NRRL B-1568]|nr:hypothetical protein VR41_10510 [Streptomyces sp. NRRL B-1568]
MDENTQDFIGSAFGPSYINEPEVLKANLVHSLSAPGIFTKTRKAQRDGFAEVIRNREMSLTDWDIITEGVIRFPTEDEMYAFLQASYDYFFGDAPEPPDYPESDEG